MVAGGRAASRSKAVDADTLWSLVVHGVGFLVVAMALVLWHMLYGISWARQRPGAKNQQHMGRKTLWYFTGFFSTGMKNMLLMPRL